MSLSEPLTPELETEAQRLAELIQKAARDEILAVARLMVSKSDRQLLGATEFEVRDLVHKIGAKAFEAELGERKKKAKRPTKAPASAARPAGKPPNSTAGGQKPSSD